MLQVDKAQAKIIAGLTPLTSETVPLTMALGRVLSQPVVSRLTQPPVAVSAMDGFAVRSADVTKPGRDLPIMGEAPAGARVVGEIRTGECFRIYTGGPLPVGADAIILQEDASVLGGRVKFNQAAEPGKHIRPAGLDFAVGDIILEPGKRLTVRDIQLAAACNHAWATVHRKPRVAVVSTGNELVRPGDTPSQTQIVGSNSFGLLALIAACGGEPVDLGIAIDDRGALDDRLIDARCYDMIVTSGGASAGEYDLMHNYLTERGVVDFWKIAMKPGKPLMYGRIDGTPIIGLPGNPVSCMVSALVFLRPALLRMAGLDHNNDGTVTAICGGDLPANDRRQTYLRARMARKLDGEWVATPFDTQDSSMMSLMAQADCLIIRGVEAPAAKLGERVPILRFNDPYDLF